MLSDGSKRSCETNQASSNPPTSLFHSDHLDSKSQSALSSENTETCNLKKMNLSLPQTLGSRGCLNTQKKPRIQLCSPRIGRFTAQSPG